MSVIYHFLKNNNNDDDDDDNDIDDDRLDWLRNYLLGGKQIVKFKLTNSDYLTIKCGVPQGSVLGPLLFLIYVIDICKNSEILLCTMYEGWQKTYI